MNSLMIGIWISNTCHRDCDQCYSNPVQSQDKMSSKVAGDVVRWITRITKEEKVKDLHISFLGGEPLNNIDVVFELADTLNFELNMDAHKQYEGVGIRYVLFTNGDLLTDEIMAAIKDRRMIILLNPTYDSLDEIERKIVMIKKGVGGCGLAIALNKLNLSRLEDLTKLAIKYHCHMRTNRLYNGGTIPGYVDEYKKQMGKMFNLLLESDWVMWPNWIMESTMPTYDPPKNPCLCGNRYLVINTDGTIRSCNPNQDTVMGLIYTHLHYKELKFSHRWSAKNIPECNGCEWAIWCQGGCPYTRKLTYGTYDKRSPFCPAFKELFPKLMALTKKYKGV